MGSRGGGSTNKAKPSAHGNCPSCGVTSSVLWRKGPEGKRDLCNACGVRWLRGKLVLGQVNPSARASSHPSRPRRRRAGRPKASEQGSEDSQLDEYEGEDDDDENGEGDVSGGDGSADYVDPEVDAEHRQRSSPEGEVEPTPRARPRRTPSRRLQREPPLPPPRSRRQHREQDDPSSNPPPASGFGLVDPDWEAGMPTFNDDFMSGATGLDGFDTPLTNDSPLDNAWLRDSEADPPPLGAQLAHPHTRSPLLGKRKRRQNSTHVPAKRTRPLSDANTDTVLMDHQAEFDIAEGADDFDIHTPQSEPTPSHSMLQDEYSFPQQAGMFAAEGPAPLSLPLPGAVDSPMLRSHPAPVGPIADGQNMFIPGTFYGGGEVDWNTSGAFDSTSLASALPSNDLGPAALASALLPAANAAPMAAPAFPNVATAGPAAAMGLPNGMALNPAFIPAMQAGQIGLPNGMPNGLPNGLIQMAPLGSTLGRVATMGVAGVGVGVPNGYHGGLAFAPMIAGGMVASALAPGMTPGMPGLAGMAGMTGMPNGMAGIAQGMPMAGLVAGMAPGMAGMAAGMVPGMATVMAPGMAQMAPGMASVMAPGMIPGMSSTMGAPGMGVPGLIATTGIQVQAVPTPIDMDSYGAFSQGGAMQGGDVFGAQAATWGNSSQLVPMALRAGNDVKAVATTIMPQFGLTAAPV